MPPPLHVAAVDIGAKKNIGWAIDRAQFCEEDEGTDIEACINRLANVLQAGPLVLGFEAPLFVPLHHDASNLTRGRRGEADRAFTTAVGSSALTCGFVVIPYILSQLRAQVPAVTARFNWTELPTASGHVLFFEAFVTHLRASDENPNIRDAKLAIARFRAGMRKGFKNIIDEPACFNLLAAILLRTGWTTGVSMLSQPCLVVRDRGAKR